MYVYTLTMSPDAQAGGGAFTTGPVHFYATNCRQYISLLPQNADLGQNASKPIILIYLIGAFM